MEADRHLSPEGWHGRHSLQVWWVGRGGESQGCLVCEHQVAGAARTEHHRPGLHQQTFIARSPGSWESDIEESEGWVSSEKTLPPNTVTL